MDFTQGGQEGGRRKNANSGGEGRAGVWQLLAITEAGIFQQAEALLDQLADFVGIVHPPEPGGVQILGGLMLVVVAASAATAGGFHPEVSNAEGAQCECWLRRRAAAPGRAGCATAVRRLGGTSYT